MKHKTKHKANYNIYNADNVVYQFRIRNTNTVSYLGINTLGNENETD